VHIITRYITLLPYIDKYPYGANKVSTFGTNNTENNENSVDCFFVFRVMLSTASIIWAILLGISLIESDHSHLISPTQDLLNLIMPPVSWMILYAIQGVFGFTGLKVHPKNKWFTFFDSMLAALLWSVTTAVMIVGYTLQDRNLPPVWASQLTMTIFAVWALMRNNYGK
jgi:hypothetical protein